MCRVWELVGPKGSEGVGLFAFFSNEKGFLAVSWVWYRRFDFFCLFMVRSQRGFWCTGGKRILVSGLVLVVSSFISMSTSVAYF